MRIYEAKVSYQLMSDGLAEVIDTIEQAAAYLKSAFEERPLQESIYLIMLNRKNKPLGRHLVSIGSMTSAMASAKEVFRPALLAGAAGIIIAHNHPSGDPAPSAGDISFTRHIREAAKIMEISMIDHVIIGNAKDDPDGVGFYSFRAKGLV